MTGSPTSLVLHGHFYQPPREDPWTEAVPEQPSAAPHHDWNQRIEEECYRALLRALPRADEDASGTGSGEAPCDEPGVEPGDALNLFEWMSFDVGPTLMWWLEREARDTHDAIVRADRTSRLRTGGHGNAVAMAYHHTILPLATARDRRTEIRWGMHDFRQRFGRDPVGMWLPETAVDDDTLDSLALEGIRFTILAPHQVEEAPAGRLPGLYRTRSGREIALFVYDGGLSHGVAFGELIHDVDRWTAAMSSREGSELIAFATDGETFGHHHRAGVTALATVVDRIRRRTDVTIGNFESVMAAHPPSETVRLVEPSSWSCSHGVERWRSECGCKLAHHEDSQQAWRIPLRQGLEAFAAGLHEVFEAEAAKLLRNPWGARDRYVMALSPDSDEGRSFFGRELRSGVDDRGRARALELLEMERNALRLFTSCAWFFDDLARVEPIQVLTYAARAAELAGARGPTLEASLLEALEQARSNDPDEGDGRRVFERHVVPRRPG